MEIRKREAELCLNALKVGHEEIDLIGDSYKKRKQAEQSTALQGLNCLQALSMTHADTLADITRSSFNSLGAQISVAQVQPFRRNADNNSLTDTAQLAIDQNHDEHFIKQGAAAGLLGNHISELGHVFSKCIRRPLKRTEPRYRFVHQPGDQEDFQAIVCLDALSEVRQREVEPIGDPYKKKEAEQFAAWQGPLRALSILRTDTLANTIKSSSSNPGAQISVAQIQLSQPSTDNSSDLTAKLDASTGIDFSTEAGYAAETPVALPSDDTVLSTDHCYHCVTQRLWSPKSPFFLSNYSLYAGCFHIRRKGKG